MRITKSELAWGDPCKRPGKPHRVDFLQLVRRTVLSLSRYLSNPRVSLVLAVEGKAPVFALRPRRRGPKSSTPQERCAGAKSTEFERHSFGLALCIDYGLRRAAWPRRGGRRTSHCHSPPVCRMERSQELSAARSTGKPPCSCWVNQCATVSNRSLVIVVGFRK
jgi:hypothetical protein